jgi:hypothetical protein
VHETFGFSTQLIRWCIVYCRRLPSKVLRISGCVRGPTTGLTKDPNRTTSVFVIAVHDENTFCTGTMELKDQVPQGQFEYDVSISDRSFSWPVFIDICRGEEFDNCRLVKVESPDGGTHGDQHRSFIDKDVGQRQPLTAARLMTCATRLHQHSATTTTNTRWPPR